MKPPSIEDWVAAEVAAMTPIPAPKGVTEEAIAEKTALGITRAQAIAIITAQAENDSRKAKAESGKLKAESKAKAK